MLNVSGDFSYVTLGAFGESARFGRRIEEMFGVTVGPPPFETPEGAPPPSPEALALDAAARTRLGLFSPGGFIAQQVCCCCCCFK